MIKLLQNKDINKDSWQELFNNSHYASFFQSKEAYDFFSSLSFVESFVYGISTNNNLQAVAVGYIIADGVWIKPYFSRRAIVLGGPLLDKDISKETLDDFLSFVKKRLKRKAIYVEIRNSFDYSKYREIFKQNGFNYSKHLNYKLELTDNFEQRISVSKKRQFKKSLNQGIKLKLIENNTELKDFYKLLKKLYKEKIKKPLFPLYFFDKLVKSEFGGILIAKYNNKVIGGLAYIMYDNIAYEWFVCGDIQNYNYLYPSVAVTYGILELSKNYNCTIFDFMGAGKPEEPYGVRDFKEKFGGDIVEYGRFRLVNKNKLYKLGKFVIKKNKIF